MTKITVQTQVNAPIEKVWKEFIEPAAIVQWNAASDDWHTTKAENDVRVGGTFSYRMEAKDGSAGFDLSGIYDAVTPHEHLTYTMSDARRVDVFFNQEDGGTRITETFDPENENPSEMQRVGWQAILDSFKRYIEVSAA